MNVQISTSNTKAYAAFVVSKGCTASRIGAVLYSNGELYGGDYEPYGVTVWGFPSPEEAEAKLKELYPTALAVGSYCLNPY